MGNWFAKSQEKKFESGRDECSKSGLEKIVSGVLDGSLKQKLIDTKAKANAFLAANPKITNGCFIGASAIVIGAIIWCSLGEKSRKQIEFKIRTTVNEHINIGKNSAKIVWKMTQNSLSYLNIGKKTTKAKTEVAISEKYSVSNKEQFELFDQIIQISKEGINIDISDLIFTPLDIRNIHYSFNRNYYDQIKKGFPIDLAFNISFERLFSDYKTLIATKKQIPIENIDLEFDKNKVDMVFPTLNKQKNTITTSNNNKNDVNININNNIENKNYIRLILNNNTSKNDNEL